MKHREYHCFAEMRLLHFKNKKEQPKGSSESALTPEQKKQQAQKYIDEGKIDEAVALLQSIQGKEETQEEAPDPMRRGLDSKALDAYLKEQRKDREFFMRTYEAHEDPNKLPLSEEVTSTNEKQKRMRDLCEFVARTCPFLNVDLKHMYNTQIHLDGKVYQITEKGEISSLDTEEGAKPTVWTEREFRQILDQELKRIPIMFQWPAFRDWVHKHVHGVSPQEVGIRHIAAFAAEELPRAFQITEDEKTGTPTYTINGTSYPYSEWSKMDRYEFMQLLDKLR